MAERRMFTKKIIDSDFFLDLPLTSQALYFHLGMRADDDGFVNSPKKIQRAVGASDDDLRLLIAKRFIIPFNSGVVVIKHWKMHNYIQKDRYQETAYREEKALLEIKENKAYTLLSSECTQTVHALDTQVSIGKDSLDKDSPPYNPPKGTDERTQSESLAVEMAAGTGNEKPVDHSMTYCDQRFTEFWAAYPKKVGKGAAEKAFKKIRPTAEVFEAMLSAIENQRRSDQWQRENGRYIPNPSTWLNQRRWEDEPIGLSHNSSDTNNIFLQMMQEEVLI